MSTLSNGDLLNAAEDLFDLFITTDQNLRYQQNLASRDLAILILMTTSWPRLENAIHEICEVVEMIQAGEYREFKIA